MVFDEGRDFLDNIALALTQAPPTQYFIALVKSDGFTSFSSSDTADDHPGWEEETNYTASTRPVFNASPASSGVVSNTLQKAMFEATADISIKGVVLWTSSGKGGTDGTLIAGEVFSDSKPMIVTAGKKGNIEIKFTGEGG